jgi:hypothetical protein
MAWYRGEQEKGELTAHRQEMWLYWLACGLSNCNL